MTDTASRGAPASTYELYCGATLILNSVTADLLAWLAEQGVVGTSAAARRRSVRDRVSNAALCELLLGLHRAASPRGEHLTLCLATAQAEAERLRGRVGDEFDELVGRLIVYRLELRDPDVLPAARERACAYAREGSPGDADILLALGLCTVTEQSHHWMSPPQGILRNSLIEHALNDVYPSFRSRAAELDTRDTVLRAMVDVTLDDEERQDLAEDRTGIVRTLASVAAAGRIVLDSVEHLPGGARAGGDRLSTFGSTPRAEFARMAGVRLPLVRDVDVRAVAAQLRAEWPWAAGVIDALLADLVGSPFARFRPTLLLGPPGAGKTRLARRLAELCGLHVTLYACAGVSDAAFGGTSRQWGTGRACVPLQAIKRAWAANPVIILDEVEKAGTRRDNGHLGDVLIPLLEPESACRHFDLYVETGVDLSCVSYIATANSLDGVPAPLLDRMRVLHVPEPEAEHLGEIARRIVEEIRRERELDRAWMPDLDGDEVGLISQHWHGGSLRLVRRLVEAVLASRETLAARH